VIVVIIDIVINTILGRLTLDPAGMHVLRGTMLLFLVVIFRLDADVPSAHQLRQRGWLPGWLGVCHSRYCIKTTKPSGVGTS